MCDGLTLVYDDESGTWGEAPEIYASIAFDTQEAFEKAVNILNNYKWISVDEALPEKDGDYLVVKECDICEGIDIAEYSENRWHKHDRVIYWQPLPDLPEAIKE